MERTIWRNASNPLPDGAALTIDKALFFTNPDSKPYNFADL
jgi:hypothetical protein